MLAPKGYFGHVDSPKDDEADFASNFAKATDEQIGRFLDGYLDGGFTAEELGVAQDASAQEFTEAENKARAYLKSSTTEAMLDFRHEYKADVLGRLMWRMDIKLWEYHKTHSDSPSPIKAAATINTQLQAIATALDIIRRRAK